jgi:hypothetical protein
MARKVDQPISINESSTPCHPSSCRKFLQSSPIERMTRAGFPPTRVFGGTSLVTTEPAATTATVQFAFWPTRPVPGRQRIATARKARNPRKTRSSSWGTFAVIGHLHPGKGGSKPHLLQFLPTLAKNGSYHLTRTPSSPTRGIKNVTRPCRTGSKQRRQMVLHGLSRAAWYLPFRCRAAKE